MVCHSEKNRRFLDILGDFSDMHTKNRRITLKRTVIPVNYSTLEKMYLYIRSVILCCINLPLGV
jgi:hypothetical protein